MLGFATIDRQPGEARLAIWKTSRLDMRAGHVNAVVLDIEVDPDAMNKLRSLTRDSVVVMTDGSTTDGLPIDGVPLTTADLRDLLAEIGEHQIAITEAVAAFKQETRTKNLTDPAFPEAPDLHEFQPTDGDTQGRALATANYLQTVWTVWLKTDEERRRRTVQPRTGQTPWIMPADMNAADVPDLPAKFAARVRVQPLV